MAYIVRMPKLGMEMQEGELLEWKVSVGDAVAEGQVIAEIESEKSVADVEAREDGVVRLAGVDPGETLEVGEPMGIVGGADEDISELAAELDSDPAATGPGTGEGTPGSASPEPDDGADPVGDAGAGTADGEPGTDDGNARASPRARRRAGELDVDLVAVQGTGPQGAVTADDVEAAAAGTELPAAGADDVATTAGTDGTAAAAGTDPTVEPAVLEERELDGMRRTIADRLGTSYREAVHVTVHRDVQVDEVLEAVDAADEALGTDVSVTDLLLVALSETLSDHPEFNATFEDGTHRLYADQDVGVAVDVESGLVAPVLRGVGDCSLEELARRRRDLTERTLEGDYTMDDLSGGTFTVTNLGVLGVDSFDPIINPPQVAILGVDRVRERPTAVNGEVAVRSWMGLDLSFDHRVVDGADAARFLETLAGHLENPWKPLFDRV